jgi:hypothetical protein
MFTEYPTMTLSLIVDFIMTIIVLASILYAINAKPENKAIATDDDDDSKKEEENEFISEWISAIKERIEYENKLSREEYKNLGDNKIDWFRLSENPNAILLLKERIEYENGLTEEEYENLGEDNKIDWEELSTNLNAIELLYNNYNKIDWERLSGNPNAIDLLKERLEYENRLNKEEYEKLGDNKINWRYVSRNENAIELLKAYPEKIHWDILDCDENTIDLLKERVVYENGLRKEEYEKLGDNKINWLSICENDCYDNYNSNIIRERFKYEISLNIEKQLSLDEETYIRWDILSNTENMNVIELLEEKLEYENGLTEEEYIRLNKYSDRCVCLLSLVCNENATKLIKNKNIIELLTNNPHKIVWHRCYEDICITDNFIELLNKLFEKNPDEIRWTSISSYHLNENPNIIMLLKKRLKYENSLSKEEYDKLKYKINRNALYIVQDFVFDGLCNDKHNQIDTNMINWCDVANDIGVNITNISKTRYIELERVLINFIINEYEEELDALSYIHDNYSFYKDNKEHKDYLKNIGRIPMSFNLINYRNILIKYEKKLSKEKYRNIECILDIFRNTHKFNKLKERIEYEKGLSEEEYKRLHNKISWYSLSKNPNVIELLKENPDKIDWGCLLRNSNPEAFELLKQNPDKIEWRYLEKNKQCIELMKSYREKIDWGELSRNDV